MSDAKIEKSPTPDSSPTRGQGGVSIKKYPAKLTAVMLVVAAAALLSLTIKPISSVDLGYHLAYGCHLLDTGEIVEGANFIHPQPTIENSGSDPFGLPPGAGFDKNGKYHFDNANWLTQLILAVLWRAGSWGALNAAMTALVAVIAAGQLVAVKRMGLSVRWAVVCWLALAMVGHERFLLRPELFAFTVISWQFAIMAGGNFSRKNIVVLIALQLLAVNLHSYWLMGVVLAGCFAGETMLKIILKKVRRTSAKSDGEQIDDNLQTPQQLRKTLIKRVSCAAIMLAVAAIHPSGLANVTYPFKTLSYVSQHNISGLNRQSVSENFANQDSAEVNWHPWQTIGEFYSPFAEGIRNHIAAISFFVLLGLSAAAVAIALYKRSWAMAAVVLLFAAASIGMRRNIILLAIIAPQICAWAAVLLVKKSDPQKQAGDTQPQNSLAATGSFAGIILSLVLVYSVVSGSFYSYGSKMHYFSLGASPITLPLKACDALDEILDKPQPVFVNQNATSTVVFWSEKTSATPTLTNTWASPPSYFNRSLKLGCGLIPASQLTQLGFKAAVIQGWSDNEQLIVQLIASPQWTLVEIDGWFAAFVHTGSAPAAKLRAAAITENNLQIKSLLDELPTNPQARSLRLKAIAQLLQTMHWYWHASEIWDQYSRSIRGEKDANGWLNYGISLAQSGLQRLLENDFHGIDSLRKAKQCFIKSRQLDPGDTKAEQYIRQVEKDLSVLSPSGH